MRLNVKNKSIVRIAICYGISILSVAFVAAALLFVFSVLIAKTNISESVSSFIAIAVYAVSTIFGSALFCVISKVRGVISGAVIGLSTCFVKLATNKFAVSPFQLATYGCIMIVCIVAGIMTANVMANREYKY